MAAFAVAKDMAALASVAAFVGMVCTVCNLLG